MDKNYSILVNFLFQTFRLIIIITVTALLGSFLTMAMQVIHRT